jgi:hypothetical protein
MPNQMRERPERERTKQIIAGAIAGWAAILVVGGISFMIANRVWSPVALADRGGLEVLRDISSVIFPPVTALLGAIIGFYFTRTGDSPTK